MKDAHESVILALNPLSKIWGNGLDPVSSATAILSVDEDFEVVDEGCVDDEVVFASADSVSFAVLDSFVFVDCLLDVDSDESSPPTCLLFKSSATVAKVQSCACAACGGGVRSTKIGAD